MNGNDKPAPRPLWQKILFALAITAVAAAVVGSIGAGLRLQHVPSSRKPATPETPAQPAADVRRDQPRS